MNPTLAATILAFATPIFRLVQANPISPNPSLLFRRNDPEDDLCADQALSAVLADLSAPTRQILGETCRVACQAAQRRTDAHIRDKFCVWNNDRNVQMQQFHIVNPKRCEDRCTQETVWSGDCACNIDAFKVYVVNDGEFVEPCDGFSVLDACFPDKTGWTTRIVNESPARPCAGTPPPP